MYSPEDPQGTQPVTPGTPLPAGPDGRLTVYYGKGNGGFVRFGPRQSVFSAGAGASERIVVGRVANRTLPDLAISNGSSRVTVLLNHSRFSRPLRRLH